VLTDVCLQLDVHELVRVAESCKRFRHGDGGLETVELPTKLPVVAALCKHAFPGGEQTPSTRLTGCSESWVAYLARSARQRRCLEAPTISAGEEHSVFLDAAGRVLACGKGAAVGHGDATGIIFLPTPAAAMAGISVKSVAAGCEHSLALGWDGRVYSWGENEYGPLGHGDRLTRSSPTLVDGLEGVRGLEAGFSHSFAVTQAGAVFSWGRNIVLKAQDSLRPIVVEGCGGARVRRVYAETGVALFIGENGELFSCGRGSFGQLGHGDTQRQRSPKRVEALQGVRMSSVSFGQTYVLALAEDGLVYSWGKNLYGDSVDSPHARRDLLPEPVEALRGVRVRSVAAHFLSNHAVSDTGEVWQWGGDKNEKRGKNCPVPTPVQSLRGVKVDMVASNSWHTLALVDDGSVYSWGAQFAAKTGALGLGPSQNVARKFVPTPRRIPALRVACGL
jgi:alpha-tubulin suppressor-like RCC1 family protein